MLGAEKENKWREQGYPTLYIATTVERAEKKSKSCLVHMLQMKKLAFISFSSWEILSAVQKVLLGHFEVLIMWEFGPRKKLQEELIVWW